MKRIVLCLLLSILLLPIPGKAESSDSTEFDLSTLAEDTVFLANLDDPTHAILGLERKADVKRYPASTTKIMTCILALESCDPDEEEPRPAADHMIRSAVRALKPIIASLPKDRRKQAADAAMRALRSAGNPPCPSASPYAALARAARKPDPADLGRRIIQSRNVNYKH